MGVSVSMDDYGTGQSTLSYLRQLPLSELKIDRSFVQHAHQNRADALMVRSTIDLAHELGIKVVAEGIEEEACLAFLRGVGCDMAQGYHIGRPMPATDFVRRLTNTSLAA
jgi:EAL domain-containing protein (putative c-di-GMP-specific phosphodiesterase class I)